MPAHANRLTVARVGVVGRGRAGTALAAALEHAGIAVAGPVGRGETPGGCLAILLCVPDGEIEAAAATVAGAAAFVGHSSGATPLSALAPAARAGAQAFGLHPLQTFVGGAGVPDLSGVGAAVAGATADALEVAEYLAGRLGMRSFVISDDGRAAYHAAASMASNFLVTLEAAAERVAGGAGLEPHQARALLLPLVRRSVENWGALGPEDALTGPVARGDEATVEAQRAAVADIAPELLSLFDELVGATRALTTSGVAA